MLNYWVKNFYKVMRNSVRIYTVLYMFFHASSVSLEELVSMRM